jgi:hypothetical protein
MTRNSRKSSVLSSVLLILLVVGCSQVALATDFNHALPMSRMGVGARPLAMGGAYVAVADDATAGYWNPAGLSQVEKFSFSSMIAANMDYDRKFNYLAVAGKFEFGSLGFSWLNAGTSDIRERDANGNPGEYFDWNDHLFIASYGNMMENFMVGFNFKVAYQKAQDESTAGVGFDAGVKYVVNEMVHIGMTATDLGTKLNKTVPATFRVGAALFPVEGFTIPIDLEKIQHKSEIALKLGGEYSYQFAEDYWAAVRGGVNDGEFTLGAGIVVAGKYGLDYAYVSEHGDAFGENHRISLTFDL